MRYAFFGTPKFAAIILERLVAAGMPPALVICNPDRPVGRKKIIIPPPVKERIMNYELGIRNKIKIIQPEKLDSEFHNSLFMLHNSTPFDFFVVAAYAKILPKEIIEMPRLGTIGVHPSLLPKYRGATPIQTTILNGDQETGTTLYLLDEKVDRGKIVSSIKCPVSRKETYESLHNKLAGLSADLLIETLPKFVECEAPTRASGRGPDYCVGVKPLPQNEAEATYTKKFKTEDGYVEQGILRQAQDDGEKIAIEIDRRIRALNPEPGIYTVRNGKRMKILEAELKDGKLVLKKVQIEGKKSTPHLPSDAQYL